MAGTWMTATPSAPPWRSCETSTAATTCWQQTWAPFKHHSFTFLKVRFTLQESGKVTMKLSRQSIKAIRRKMDIFRAWVTEGQMDAEDAIQSYQSWRAHAKRCDSYRTLEAMDVRRRKNKFPCTLRAKKTKAGWEYTRITQQATQAA